MRALLGPSGLVTVWARVLFVFLNEECLERLLAVGRTGNGGNGPHFALALMTPVTAPHYLGDHVPDQICGRNSAMSIDDDDALILFASIVRRRARRCFLPVADGFDDHHARPIDTQLEKHEKPEMSFDVVLILVQRYGCFSFWRRCFVCGGVCSLFWDKVAVRVLYDLQRNENARVLFCEFKRSNGVFAAMNASE